MSEPRRKAFPLNGGTISCLQWGDSEGSPLLFAHANGFNAQTYRVLLDPLAKDLRVLACDLRGHGSSTVPAHKGLATEWIVFRDDIVALCEMISDKPLILSGHSLGATASLMAAAWAPARVRALVLVEPVLLPAQLRHTNGGPNNLAEIAAQRRSTFPSFAAAVDYYRGRGFFARWPVDILKDYLAGGLKENGDGRLLLACAPEWESEIFRHPPFGVAEVAAQVTCPVTILRGTVASTARDDQVAIILSSRPDARVVTIEGATHFLPIEQPERVRQEILQTAAAIRN
jgi:pimeloyl-ACP methyl ester carboxylesterase